MAPRVKVWVVLFFIRFQISIYWYLAVWIGIQVISVYTGVHGTAWFAHLGGFAAGALLAIPFRKKSIDL